jgi:hypothetical protein
VSFCVFFKVAFNILRVFIALSLPPLPLECDSAISSVVAKQSFPPTFAAMFEKLRNKWKVNGLQLALILTTFAVGGSLTGYAGRKLMHWLTIDEGWFFLPVYIILLSLLWPLMVLLVSIPFGQFRFFVGYLKKIGKRIGLNKTKE